MVHFYSTYHDKCMTYGGLGTRAVYLDHVTCLRYDKCMTYGGLGTRAVYLDYVTCLRYDKCMTYGGLGTRAVYLDYVTCLRYTILVGHPPFCYVTDINQQNCNCKVDLSKTHGDSAGRRC